VAAAAPSSDVPFLLDPQAGLMVPARPPLPSLSMKGLPQSGTVPPPRKASVDIADQIGRGAAGFDTARAPGAGTRRGSHVAPAHMSLFKGYKQALAWLQVRSWVQCPRNPPSSRCSPFRVGLSNPQPPPLARAPPAPDCCRRGTGSRPGPPPPAPLMLVYGPVPPPTLPPSLPSWVPCATTPSCGAWVWRYPTAASVSKLYGGFPLPPPLGKALPPPHPPPLCAPSSLHQR
jgi:hypothetical protein